MSPVANVLRSQVSPAEHTETVEATRDRAPQRAELAVRHRLVSLIDTLAP